MEGAIRKLKGLLFLVPELFSWLLQHSCQWAASQRDFAITQHNFLLAHPSLQHLSKLLCHPVGHHHTLTNELWQGGRAISKFIPFVGFPGGSGCSLYVLFLYSLEFYLPLLVVNSRLLVNSSLYYILPVQITSVVFAS